jgi:UDP-3-O-[3-hydroxymyristoyl] glucosamine N-acyltransferase
LFPLSTHISLSELIAEAANRLNQELLKAGGEPLPAPLIEGEDIVVKGLYSSSETMGEGSLTFATDKKYLALAVKNQANAVITAESLLEGLEGKKPSSVIFKDPRLLFVSVLNLLESESRPNLPQGEPLFADKESVTIGLDVKLGPYTYIGKNVSIGNGSVIGPYCFIEDDVEIGDFTTLHPRVTLRWRVKVGSYTQIHSGSVIGGDGFGYTQVPISSKGRLFHLKNSHLGSVVIGDHVEIGSLSAVDRGLVEDTVIESGTKLDNLVQIGHNVKIGKDAIIVSQVGIAGHSVVGDRAFVLGQVGLSHGAVVGEDAIVTGQTGVTKKIPPGRKAWGGTPARPMEEYLRDQGNIHLYLPRLKTLIDELKKSQSFDEFKKNFFDSKK